MAVVILGLWAFVEGLNPDRVQYAVNCGGPALTTNDGVIYRADEGYSTGIPSDFGKTLSFRYTDTPELYETERYAESSFYYDIPVEDSGEYVLIVKLSEVYFASPGQKVFDVVVGETVLAQDIDIFDQVGKGAAYDLFVPLSLEGENVLVKGQLLDSLRGGKLRLHFIKKELDNPKVNAIVLFKGPLQGTNHAEQEAVLSHLRQVREKLNEEQEQRYHEYVDEEDELDYEAAGTEPELQEAESLLSILFTTPGFIFLCVISVLGLFAVLSSMGSSTKQKAS